VFVELFRMAAGRVGWEPQEDGSIVIPVEMMVEGIGG